MSKHVMAKHKVAISVSRDHIPREMEGTCEKLKIKRLVKSCTPMRKVLIASRFSFTVVIYNCLHYHQYKVAASAPRLVMELG